MGARTACPHRDILVPPAPRDKSRFVPASWSFCAKSIGETVGVRRSARAAGERRDAAACRNGVGTPPPREAASRRRSGPAVHWVPSAAAGWRPLPAGDRPALAVRHVAAAALLEPVEHLLDLVAERLDAVDAARVELRVEGAARGAARDFEHRLVGVARHLA